MTNKEYQAINFINAVIKMQNKITKEAIKRNSPYAQKQKDIYEFVSKMSHRLLMILAD